MLPCLVPLRFLLHILPFLLKKILISSFCLRVYAHKNAYIPQLACGRQDNLEFVLFSHHVGPRSQIRSPACTASALPTEPFHSVVFESCKIQKWFVAHRLTKAGSGWTVLFAILVHHLDIQPVALSSLTLVFMLKISALLISNSDSDLLTSVMEDVIWNLPAEYLCINGCVTSGVKSCWLYVEHLTSMHNGNGRLLQPGLWGWSDSVGPWRTLLCNCFISADSVPVWCLTFFFLSSSCVFVLR